MEYCERCKLCGNSYLDKEGLLCTKGEINRANCKDEKKVVYESVSVDLTPAEEEGLRKLAASANLDFETYCSKLLEKEFLEFAKTGRIMGNEKK